MALIDRLRWRFASLPRRIIDRLFLEKRSERPADERQWELTSDELAAYHRVRVAEISEVDLVDDRTWSDLEMGRICRRLDRSVTPLGSQYLYSHLRCHEDDPGILAANAEALKSLRANPAAVERLRRSLAQLNRGGAARLAEVLFGTPLTTPRQYRIFYLLSAAAILCPFGLLISPWFLAPSVGFWVLNIALHYIYGESVVARGPALKSLAVLVGCVPKMCEALRGTDLPEAIEINSLAGTARKVQKQISRAFLRNYAGDDITAIITEYLNLLCLFELSAFCRATVAVNEEQSDLARLFRIIARLDAFQGLAAALFEYPSICVPEFQPGRSFTLVAVYHPLLNHPVSNTVAGTGRSILLSGTNMSGKTTFIKTLGVNLILAQTLGLCLAEKAVLPSARVRTLIDRQDTILTGQSYFFFEATELLRMLKEAEQPGRQFWFILDEIFRGTNTIERVAAGAAVLNHLSQRGFVVASTHDYELTNLLKKEFDSYHFSEVVDGNEARFDYRLRKGPCTTRNAIKLLALAGYPNSVIDLAESLQFERQ